MNLFDNQRYYDKDEFDKVSYEDQQEIFLRIRAWMPRVSERDRYNQKKYRNIIISRIEQICAYACAGHIPSQDYMGYIYKRGFGDIFPVNYKRSIEWSIIAARNGSKLAPQRMKAFMNPAIDIIMEKELIEEDTNEKGARIFFDRFRDRCVSGAIDNLIKSLPEDVDENEAGEVLMSKEEKENKKKYDTEFVELNIEDIDSEED